MTVIAIYYMITVQNEYIGKRLPIVSNFPNRI